MKPYTFFFFLLMNYSICAQNNLSLLGKISSSQSSATAEVAIDGNPDTYWQVDEVETEKWLFIMLPGATEIKKVVVSLEDTEQQPIAAFAIQTYINGYWKNQKEQTDNTQRIVTVEFSEPILNDRIRLMILSKVAVRVKEIEIYGQEYIAEEATPVKAILTNQSGYNLDAMKRFTAPNIDNNAPFQIQNTRTQEVVFQGTVKDHIGDFSDFNPLSSDEFIIKIDTMISYPFRVGPYWLERVCYQNMVDFMTGARHYVGTTNKIQPLSWAWRDGDFFNWALQSLIAQYLSNPEAYKRLNQNVKYINNADFPPEYKGKWGKLAPYKTSAPDIVKLIHWDVDVKVSQGLEHEHQKSELAHFLYAFPYLKEWLPQQNFEIVYAYVKAKWGKTAVNKASTSKYDKSPEHDLFALKTQLGTLKGELPPGVSVIPNLMMYEVAKSQGDDNAETYFQAAYRQMEWLIANLDWEDPKTTKGQRLSEHITMRAFAYFYHQFPDHRPKGLYEKVKDWATVAIQRSHNMWDFRKYTDDGDWVPAGWNETGNVLGFPAAALAAKSVLQEEVMRKELDRLVWSHFDDAFGRNPTGRHFSYDGPKEIEGVDQGWYNAHKGGIGLLEPVRFVFDGSPKTNHYPNHPEVGNIGWTEGWVQFNTAFNTSMAYLAYDALEIELTKFDEQTIRIRLKAPLNFDEDVLDQVIIQMQTNNGETMDVLLTEEGKYAKYLSGTVTIKRKKLKHGRQSIKRTKNTTLTVNYGLGYFKKEAMIELSDSNFSSF